MEDPNESSAWEDFKYSIAGIALLLFPLALIAWVLCLLL